MNSFTSKEYIFNLNDLKESEIKNILSLLTLNRIKFELENKILKVEALPLMALRSLKIKKILLSRKV